MARPDAPAAPVDRRQVGLELLGQLLAGRDEDLWTAPRDGPGPLPAPRARAWDAAVMPPSRERACAPTPRRPAGSWSPPRSGRRAAPTRASVGRKAALLRGWIDAANVTDNQSAHVRLASLAGSVLAARAGVEPVMQLTCRDRNRIALQSDLISAGTLGIPNVLLLTGDHPRFGDHPDAKPVFDLDCVQLCGPPGRCATRAGCCPGAGRRRAAACSSAPSRTRSPRRCASAPTRLGQEGRGRRGVRADPVHLRRRRSSRGGWRRCGTSGCPQRCCVLAGVGPIRSLRALEYIRTQRARHPRARRGAAAAARGAGGPGGRGGRALCVETSSSCARSPGWPASTSWRSATSAASPRSSSGPGWARRSRPAADPGARRRGGQPCWLRSGRRPGCAARTRWTSPPRWRRSCGALCAER